MSKWVDSKVDESLPSDPVWAPVVDALRRVSRVPAAGITPKSELANDLGIDSVSLMDLAITLEKALRIQIDERGLASVSTAGDLVELVKSSAPRPSE